MAPDIIEPSLKKHIYDSVNSTMPFSLKNIACELYDNVFEIMYRDKKVAGEGEFARLVLPIAKFIVDNCEITNIPETAMVLSNYLSQYIVNENGSNHYAIPENILENYPSDNPLKDINKMSVLACEFIDHFQNTRSY